jgi:hypothetical protein
MDMIMKAMDNHFNAQKGAVEVATEHQKNAMTIAHQKDKQQQDLALGAQAFNQQQKQKKAATPKGKKKP